MSGKYLRTTFALVVLLIFTISITNLNQAQAAPSLPIIPGASGFGITTPAGSGRNLSTPQTSVFRVTNLNASGSGSLASCVNASGPRTCIFEISGTIQLTSELKIQNPYLTIAGQTAPAPGIMIRGAGLRITTHDVLVQHLRIRVGDASNGPGADNRDGIGIEGHSGVYNIVIDHVSVSWAVDGNIDLWYEGVEDVTISNSIFAEGLFDSIHPEGTHSTGMLIGGKDYKGGRRISVLNNLFIHNHQRNPLFAGDGNSSIVIANNLIYDWVQDGTSLRHGGLVSAVGNVYIPGKSTTATHRAISVLEVSGIQIYLADAIVNGSKYADPWGVVFGSTSPRVNSPPIWIDGYTALDSSAVNGLIVANAGARPVDRDPVDIRLINDLKNGTGRIIDSQSDVGGWPGYAVISRPLTLPSNPNGDSDGDGYTNLEEWLHDYAAQVEGGTPAPSPTPTPYPSPTQTPVLAPTFADVPFSHWAHDYIEVLYQQGYVSGCDTNPLRYCPEATMTRSESAVFVERGIHNAGYTPAEPSQQVFDDVPLSTWYAKWSVALFGDGYTAGCGEDPLIFCPLQGHTRTEATVFFLRMRNGSGYNPPAPAGIFSDVPVDYWGAKWIEAAYNAGLITACDTSPVLRFCPYEPLDRATAAYMMVKAKGLELP